MKDSARTALVVGSMLLLGGCNMVVSDKPMFTVANGAGAAPIRPGVWRAEIPDCDVDESLPQNKWPACAQAQPAVGNPPLWLQVSGDPAILQFSLPISLDAAGGAGTTYLYTAYVPLKLDAGGRVVAMRQWQVRCGPPPEPERAKVAGSPADPAAAAPMRSGLYSPSDPRSLRQISGAPMNSGAAQTDPDAKAPAAQTRFEGAADKLTKLLEHMTPTKSPFPGLVMTKTGGCAPHDAAAVRNAAKMSEGWLDAYATSHWVRDPIPGDKPPITAASLAALAKQTK